MNRVLTGRRTNSACITYDALDPVGKKMLSSFDFNIYYITAQTLNAHSRTAIKLKTLLNRTLTPEFAIRLEFLPLNTTHMQ
jgi:hypothetical protein